MRIVPFIFIAFVCLAASGANLAQNDAPDGAAPVIKKISIKGAKKITPSTIFQKVRTRAGEKFDRDILQRDLGNIVRLYASKNLFLVRIDSVQHVFSNDSSEITITIFLTEGRAIEIGRIQFIGNTSVASADLLNAMRSGENDFFDPAVLERDVDELVAWYENRGFPFARIVITELKLHEESDRPKLSITLTIQENKKTMLSRLDMTGQEQTKGSVLTREMRLALPRVYRRIEMQEGMSRIRKYSFITDIQEGELLPVTDSSYALQFFVTEGPSNTIDGIAGYVPKTAASKGYFTGFANLSFQNLFGTARRLDAQWQKKNRYTQEFMLAYTEPWVMNYPVNFGGSFRQLVQDTIYTERQWTLDGSTWFGSYTSGLFGFSIKTVDPSDAATGFVYNIPTADFKSAYLGFAYDTRDNPYNPRNGVLYRATAEYVRKNENYFVTGAESADTMLVNGLPVLVEKKKRSISTQKLSLDVEFVYPFTRRFVFFNAVHGVAYKSPQSVVPYSEQIRFGGLRTVRGYAEDFFNGTRVGWNNFELRWLISPRSRLFTFADIGYYFRRERSAADSARIVRERDWPLGYGFGIRFETKLGLFALDFGLGKDDSFAEGKVHFGIASQF
jgi:outer membrane protein assembly factor BamA